jgi:hypothetical protein
MLGIEEAEGTERAWFVPAAVLIGTILGFLVIGQVTAAPLYVSLPNGVIIALVMAGLSVACMSPGTGDGPAPDPPADRDESPVLGSPGGPWMVVAHIGASPPAEPLPAELVDRYETDHHERAPQVIQPLSAPSQSSADVMRAAIPRAG